MAMGVKNGSTANDADIRQYTYNGSDSQKFGFIKNANGSYRIVTKVTNGQKNLSVNSVSTEAGANIAQYEYVGGTNDHWFLESYSTKALSTSNYVAFSLGNDNKKAYNYFNTVMQNNTVGNNSYKRFADWSYDKGQIKKEDLLNYWRYSDVAYIDSHAYPDRIAMMDNNITTYNNIYLDSDLGTAFKSGSTTKTNSIFNKKTKCIIIQACSQLDFNSSASSSQNSAIRWARAMLGDGKRLHGVLGYYGSAPANDTAYDRLNTFLGTQTNSDNRPNMILGWKLAHEPLIGKSQWAAIWHSANINDKMFWGWTADTSSNSAYTIERYALDCDIITLPVAASSANINSVSKNNQLLLPSLSKEQNISLQQNTISANKKDLILKKLKNSRTDERFLTFSPDDTAFDFIDHSIQFTEMNSVKFNADSAVQKSIQALKNLGIMPDKDYEIQITATTKETLNLMNPSQSSVKEIVSYSIDIYHTFNGIPIISDDNEGIQVEITNGGVSQIRYKWSNIISGEQIRKNFVNENTLMQNYKQLTNISVNQKIAGRPVYVLQNNQCTSAYVIGKKQAFIDPTYFEAATGEKLDVK